MKITMLKTGDLKEHSENQKWFANIKEISPAFWEEFKENIDRIGIIEPLQINEQTMEVLSGNQRLQACIEIGKEEIPCIFVSVKKDSPEEIMRMISANIMRRGDPDPLKLMEYIGILRKGYNGKKRDGLSTEDEIQKSQDVGIFIGFDEGGFNAQCLKKFIPINKYIDIERDVLLEIRKKINQYEKEFNEL